MMTSIALLLLGAAIAIVGIALTTRCIAAVQNYKFDMRELKQLRDERALGLEKMNGYW